jgi:tRNA-specific 2-thiouridylase
LARKAIALLSGGLDSRLAVKMMLDQGIEVEALNFITIFCTCTAKSSCKSEARKAAEEYGIPLKVLNATDRIIDAVKNPRHGHGRGLNPCIDCRVSMFRRAGEYMHETGADFIITGEVLGERPMSQRSDAMEIIERESGLEGLIVRPLSAHLFEPSIPEREGWVDREEMMAMRGRSRKPQIQLAMELGVTDYPCPAGGCLLTEKVFAARLKRLLAENSEPSVAEIQSLKLGRLFYSSSGDRIIIPRNQAETESLSSLAQPGDIFMSAADFNGPTTVIKSMHAGEQTLGEAAALTARYGQGRTEDKITICYSVTGSGKEDRPARIEARPAQGERLSQTLERL